MGQDRARFLWVSIVQRVLCFRRVPFYATACACLPAFACGTGGACGHLFGGQVLGPAMESLEALAKRNDGGPFDLVRSLCRFDLVRGGVTHTHFLEHERAAYPCPCK